ncbi:hypothetical protein AAFG13_31930 [Bradyrhizobium sp. B124]|uniref:hypothetical protein n=1 Tax=Bradyrhizobium sp. B124 TaxID=3140245 RepID=UPI003182E4D0
MAAPQNRERFELRRQDDVLVHSVVRNTRPDGTVGYQHQDRDFWIEHRPGWSRLARAPQSQTCTGRPWNVLPADQGDHPPEGDRVSRKGTKSYVYSLVYVS